MPWAIFLKKIKYKSSLDTFKYGTKLVYAFGFQPLRHEYAIFSFEFIKDCLCRLRENSATRNIKSRLAIKFPTPYEWWSNALPPGKKRPQMPGVFRGGDVEASIWLVHYSLIGKHILD